MTEENNDNFNMATTARRLLDSELNVINIGLDIFYDALRAPKYQSC